MKRTTDPMEINTVRHLWGVEEWEVSFPKIKANGYTAVETCPGIFDEATRASVGALCRKHGLKLVYQIHTDDYSQFPKRKKDVKDHLNRFKELLEDAKKNFGDLLLFVNSHSGYDGWTTDQRNEFFSQAVELQKSYSFVIAHETHRARAMYNPWVTRELVQKFPDLKLTADLSHWFNVCERALDDEMDVIHAIAKNVYLIHGRVGHSQGPQVPDPRSELWSKWLTHHELCWDAIWKAQKDSGAKISYFEPEFGPPPYAWVTGYGTPQTNVWEICEWMTKREVERFKASH